MQILTRTLSKKLQDNWTLSQNAERKDETFDPKPVIKLFTPWGSATWLITEQSPDDPDILFGLCDLGLGSPELGYVSLQEITGLTGPGGLTIERDIHFKPRMTLAEYTEDASKHSRIVA